MCVEYIAVAAEISSKPVQPLLKGRLTHIILSPARSMPGERDGGAGGGGGCGVIRRHTGGRLTAGGRGASGGSGRGMIRNHTGGRLTTGGGGAGGDGGCGVIRKATGRGLTANGRRRGARGTVPAALRR